MSELRYPFFQLCSMETKHSFIILNLIPYEFFLKEMQPRSYLIRQKKTVVFISISMVTGVRGK